MLQKIFFFFLIYRHSLIHINIRNLCHTQVKDLISRQPALLRLCPRDHWAWGRLNGGGNGAAAELPVPGGGGVRPERRLLLLQEGPGEHRGRPGDAALLLRGAGLVEPPDPDQSELPLHQPPPHHFLGHGRVRAILCALPPQVSVKRRHLSAWYSSRVLWDCLSYLGWLESKYWHHRSLVVLNKSIVYL